MENLSKHKIENAAKMARAIKNTIWDLVDRLERIEVTERDLPDAEEINFEELLADTAFHADELERLLEGVKSNEKSS